jgi:hypothetical protein
MTDTLTVEQRVEAELAGEMPKHWHYTVSTTANTLKVRAVRWSDGGSFTISTDRRNPLHDVREFIAMCKLLDR